MRSSNSQGWQFFFAIAFMLMTAGVMAFVEGGRLQIGDLSDWLGALAGLGAVFAALQIAGRQARDGAKKAHAQDVIFLKAVIAAGEHADIILGSTQDLLEDSRPSSVEGLLDFTAPAELERAEQVLRSFPLHQAPTPECVDAVLLMTAALSEARQKMLRVVQSPFGLPTLSFANDYDLLKNGLDEAKSQLEALSSS